MHMAILTAILGALLAVGTTWRRGLGANSAGRRISAHLAGAPGEASVDRATLAGWLAVGRELRLQASALAEKPPLTSY